MIYPITLALTGLLAIMLFLLPRKYSIIPFILAACFIPSDQRIIIADLDFTPLRMLVLAGFLMLILNWPRLKLTSFDYLVFAFGISGALIYCLQWGDSKGLIHQSGVLFDIFGMYLIFSAGLNSWDKIEYTMRIFAICSIVTAFFIAIEWSTGKNPFAVLGKVKTVIRDGRYRCEGPFPHSIISGLFWGMLVPIFIAMAMTDKKKLLYKTAIAASIFIVAATSSSTPLLSLMIVLGGMVMFKWRNYVTSACWGSVAALTTLHFIMERPVWHLLSRIDVFGGSTGWHRYILLDRAINHFSEWAMFGCRSTEHWGFGMHDVTNQFIYEGVRGGFITLVIFLILLFMAFKFLYKSSFIEKTYKYRLLGWAFFVSLAGHFAAFFAVSYFGQIMMLWYMTLAVTAFMARRQLMLNAEKAMVRRLKNIKRTVFTANSLAVGNRI